MTLLNRSEIEALIPHRAPFLWVDEVVEMTESHIIARKFLDPALDVFQGHYPDFPVLPGVLQCEACLQASAILIAKLMPVAEGEVPVATRLNNVQFRKMVRPGQTIQLEVRITERLSNAFFLTGKVTVDGKTTTRLEFTCASAPANAG